MRHARAHTTHMPNVTSQGLHMINHVTMTSPAFAFHSCDVETRWHDVIGVRVVETPCYHGLHRMGMT